MEKEFDHEVTLAASEIRYLLETGEAIEKLDDALDSAQGNAKTKGVAQRILLVIEPDTEEPEGLDEGDEA